MIVRLLRQPPRRRTSNAELSSVSHKATVNRKVRNSVHVGPPSQGLIHIHERGCPLQAPHHRRLPDYSTLLSGRIPPDTAGFRSDKLQIRYNNSPEGWSDPKSRARIPSSDDVSSDAAGAR